MWDVDPILLAHQAVERFHTSSLRSILSILWQEKVANLEALDRARSKSIETMILKTQLRWTSHVIRMEQDSMPRQLSEYSMVNWAEARGSKACHRNVAKTMWGQPFSCWSPAKTARGLCTRSGWLTHTDQRSTLLFLRRNDAAASMKPVYKGKPLQQ